MLYTERRAMYAYRTMIDTLQVMDLMALFAVTWKLHE